MAIKVVDIIVERKGMILLIKRGDFWILPGAEIEAGKDEMQCLEDVVAKEMNDQIASVFRKLEKTVTGPSPVSIFSGNLTGPSCFSNTIFAEFTGSR